MKIKIKSCALCRVRDDLPPGTWPATCEYDLEAGVIWLTPHRPGCGRVDAAMVGDDRA